MRFRFAEKLIGAPRLMVAIAVIVRTRKWEALARYVSTINPLNRIARLRRLARPKLRAPSSDGDLSGYYSADRRRTAKRSEETSERNGGPYFLCSSSRTQVARTKGG